MVPSVQVAVGCIYSFGRNAGGKGFLNFLTAHEDAIKADIRFTMTTAICGHASSRHTVIGGGDAPEHATETF